MTTPRLLLPLLLTALLAGAAGATPITQNADLSGTVHDGENHSGANGSNSLFINASFVGTNLSSTNLRNADFTGADLTGATLTGAQLRDADFTNAVLDGASLSGAQVRGVDFTGASFVGTDLSTTVQWSLANWTGALFDATTLFPTGMDPLAEGMLLVGEPHAALMLGAGLLGLGLFGRRRID